MPDAAKVQYWLMLAASNHLDMVPAYLQRDVLEELSLVQRLSVNLYVYCQEDYQLIPQQGGKPGNLVCCPPGSHTD